MSTPSYDDIRKQIERRYRRRSLFVYHFIIAFACLPAIWMLARSNGVVAFIITVLWVGLLALHAVRLYMESAKDRAIERTWQHYYGDAPFINEKPKRTFHLSDDAELEVIEDEAAERKYMRGQ